MSRSRGGIILAALQVFSEQTEPVTWSFVADELACLDVISTLERLLVRRVVVDMCKRGVLVKIQGFTGGVGCKRSIWKYWLLREGDAAPKPECMPFSLADAMKTWNS